MIFFALLFLCCTTAAIGQRDDIELEKEKKEFAFNSIKELKNGALVVRLQTNHRKIAILEATLRDPKLKPAQYKRHKAILDGTVKRRNEFNETIAKMFADSFRFCPVYLMYDTCSDALAKGVRKGLFLNKQLQPDTSIELPEPNVFLVNYVKSNSDFPFDVLRVRKLHEKLDDPFPYFASVRESWINAVNTPRAASAVAELDRRFRRFHARALEYDEKQAEKAAKKKA